MKRDMKNKLLISTIDENAPALAREYGVGLEIADFCWAQKLDIDLEDNLKAAERKMEGVSRFRFHAPFAELSPCAIDPKARELTRERYSQAVKTAQMLGISDLVIHGGFIPHVYFPEYFVSESISFWKDFISGIDPRVSIAIENVMEPGPEMLVKIVDAVGSERLGLCLDVGHANCSISDTAPIEWLRTMKDKLFHLHIHNNFGGEDIHAPLGSGTVPMEELLDEALTCAPNASFTIENMNSRPSIEWLVDKGYLKNDRI